MTRRMLLFLIACISIYRPLLTGEDDSECLLSKSSEPLLGFIDANDNRRSDLTNIEAEPSSYILNAVSVISGEYTDSTTDYIIPGPDPLPIQRVYSSGEHGNGSICCGLYWGKHSYLSLSEVRTQKNKTEIQASIVGGGGSRMTYTEVGDRNYKLHNKCFQKGLTNTSTGIVSGRTNPLNDQLKRDKKYDVFTLTSGGGVAARV